MKKFSGTTKNGKNFPQHPSDIYIKDEGDDFSTVIFQTPEAQRVASNIEAYETINGKMDVLNDELHKILAWAVSHNLTVDSEITITIPEYDNK